MFKKMLKYAENFAHHAHVTKNRWEESDQIVSKAAELILEKQFLSRELKLEPPVHRDPSAVIQEVSRMTEIKATTEISTQITT